MENILSSKWMRGRCFDLAIQLNKKTKLPIYGLFDLSGNCHHAFVFDEKKGLGIDARGLQPISDLAYGCAGKIMAKTNEDFISNHVLNRPLSPYEKREATIFINEKLLFKIKDYLPKEKGTSLEY